MAALTKRLRITQAIAKATVLRPFAAARSVALFFPLLERKEVDLRGLDAEARRLGKRVYYPFLEPRDGSLVSGLRLTSSLADLAERGQRFLEPPPEARLVDDWFVWQPHRAPMPEVVLGNSGKAGEWRLCANGQCRTLSKILGHDVGPHTTMMRACE